MCEFRRRHDGDRRTRCDGDAFDADVACRRAHGRCAGALDAASSGTGVLCFCRTLAANVVVALPQRDPILERSQ